MKKPAIFIAGCVAKCHLLTGARRVPASKLIELLAPDRGRDTCRVSVLVEVVKLLRIGYRPRGPFMQSWVVG